MLFYPEARHELYFHKTTEEKDAIKIDHFIRNTKHNRKSAVHCINSLLLMSYSQCGKGFPVLMHYFPTKFLSMGTLVYFCCFVNVSNMLMMLSISVLDSTEKLILI